MPNHYCNTLIMSEDTLPVIIQNYVRYDERGEKIFDFEKIIPVGEVPDWYEQKIAKWGTKWPGYDLNIGESVMDFYTAWSPPVPVIKKLAELHKDMVFHLDYYESGDAFRGYATAKWQDGEVACDEQSWDMTDDDFKELGLL